MNVLMRKELEVREEKRKIKKRLDFIGEETHRLVEIQKSMKERLDYLFTKCAFRRASADEIDEYKELKTKEPSIDFRILQLIRERNKLENIPEPEVEIGLGDLTFEEMDRVQFTRYGWRFALDDGRVIEIIRNRKSFIVLNPKIRCA